MRRELWLTLLLFPLSAAAQVSTSMAYTATSGLCTQTCSDQDFDGSSGDPFATPAWVLSAVGSCPITWDSTNGWLVRTSPAGISCDGSTAFARYEGNIAENGCAIYQAVSDSDDETLAGGKAFEPGIVFRLQAGSTTGRGYVVRCETGTDCTPLRFQSIDGIDGYVNDCGTFGAVPDGGYFGICVRGTGPATVVNAFNLGVTAPTSGPATTDGGGGWGAPQCTFTGCPFGGLVDCDNSGTQFGVWLRSNDAGAGAKVEIDNFKAYSCQ